MDEMSATLVLLERSELLPPPCKIPQTFLDLTLVSRWRKPTFVFHTKWNVNNLPTLVRFQEVDGQVQETGRLVESEILDSKALEKFVSA